MKTVYTCDSCWHLEVCKYKEQLYFEKKRVESELVNVTPNLTIVNVSLKCKHHMEVKP